ncbi:alpha/beta fold hydrolase [Microbacterium gorillae]|uniref:alpha/beta fold hydrolase n=1 Tax=Microbacterium gorillae TaxID=1231063 RepID=UPI000AE02354|nr:alpha/beta hydrolase [Microbacterium gorillae]
MTDLPASHHEEVDESISDKVTEAAGAPVLDGDVSRFHWEGAEMVVEEFGSGEPVFLLVHGIGMGRVVFAELIADLRRRGRVLAIDQPGYGDSAEPPRTPTMERTADMLAALLTDRGYTGVIAIGHSMGTQVVAELAVRHPTLVSATVLIAPTVDEDARRVTVQIGRLIADLWGESRKVVLLGAWEYLRAGPHLIRKIRAMMVHRPEKVYPRITQPTLVLRGENDKVVPDEWGHQVAALVPNAIYDVLPHTSHQSMIRDAGPTSRRIGLFLDDHPERRRRGGNLRGRRRRHGEDQTETPEKR